MARKGFIPDSYKNPHDWSANLSGQHGAIATRINGPTASVTARKAQLDGLTTGTKAVLDAQAALDATVSQPNQASGTALPAVRLDTKNLRATSGFTEGDAKTLGVYATPETFNPNTYQPTLEATSKHNYVELMAKKFGVDSPNLYWRPAGTANSLLLSAKRTRFPFHDDTPAPAGQTMQAREYMAMGVVGDDEVGN